MNETTTNADESNPSMQQILQSIRGVISGDEKLPENTNNEVLELTEVVNDDGSITSLSDSQKTSEATDNASAPSSEAINSNDVLNNIDNALGIKNPNTPSNETAENSISEEPKVQTQEAPLTSPEADIQAPLEEVSEKQLDEKTENENKEEVNNFDNKSISEKTDKSENITAGKSIETAPLEPSNLESPKQVTDEDLKTKQRLISEQAANASSDALKKLVKTVSKPISDGLAFKSGATVEDLVVELIRPYLSNWLDANLPSIVKHLVEKEIQKLIPKDED